MVCYTGQDNKETIAHMNKVLDDQTITYAEKVEAINAAQRALGTIDNPATLYNDVKDTYTRLSIDFPQEAKIKINKAEMDYSKAKKKNEPVKTSIILDGNRYTAIHSEHEMRVFKSGFQNYTAIIKTLTDNMKDRKEQLREELSVVLSDQFKNKKNIQIQTEIFQIE